MTALPGDWIAGVVVPLAAVLVSAGIAIGLARRERRAADRDRAGVAASRLIRALTDLARDARRGPTAVASADAFLGADLNEFSVALDAADADVPKYVAGVLATATRTHDPAVLEATAVFLVGAIEGWVRGSIPTRRFTETMPALADEVWVSGVRLEDWAAVTAPPAPGRT